MWQREELDGCSIDPSKRISQNASSRNSKAFMQYLLFSRGSLEYRWCQRRGGLHPASSGSAGMVLLSRCKRKSREVFLKNMCWFYGHCPYRGKKGGGEASAKRNGAHYFRKGKLREVRMISEEKAHFCREDLPKSYFLRPSLVFLPHTKSFILLLHLLHLGKKIIDICLFTFFTLK